jgi:hypothetical protein
MWISQPVRFSEIIHSKKRVQKALDDLEHRWRKEYGNSLIKFRPKLNISQRTAQWTAQWTAHRAYRICG